MSAASLRLRLKERPYLWAYLGGSTVLIICIILWWFIVYLGPQHVFWSMVSNSLAAPGVVVETSQTQGKNSLQQQIHVDTSAQMAHSLTTLKQDGNTVKTEVIGTKTADYTRYAHIQSATKADTSQLTNVWSKSDDAPQTDTQASAHQLYAQTTLGIGLPLGSVPIAIGNLPPQQRTTLYKAMRSQGVYAPDLKTVKIERKQGHLIYTYSVKIQTILYISMMKDFARDLGLHELEAADPNSFSGTPTFDASISVDAFSHQLTAVNFEKLGYSQTYRSFGLPLHVTPPQKFISEAELQKRLAELGQAKQ